jgi:aminobenzoyl-glutamate transport protein
MKNLLTQVPGRLFNRFLNTVERAGNILPNPLTLFALLAVAIPPISALLSTINLEVTHPVRGTTETVTNLLTGPYLQRMMTEAIDNFTSFAPLGLVLVAMIGIALAEKSGLIACLLRLIVTRVSPRFITPALIFAGILSSLAADVGYIILPPLGALVFLSVGRHPLAGFAAVVAGVSGAFSANLFLTPLDPLLSGLTHSAALTFDPDYVVTPLANYYLMVVSAFILVPLGWFAIDRILEPRLGEWKKPEGLVIEKMETAFSRKEKKGLIFAGLTFIACLAAIALLVIPEGSLLRDADGGIKPFYDALIVLLAVSFFLPGLIYGIAVGTIRNDHDVARMTGETMATMGTYIVLAFAAAQFIEFFRWSNLGIVSSLSGASLLARIGLTHIPLLLGLIVVAGIINIFIGSASAKWAMMSVIIVPLMMSLGFSPELAQAAYRIGDSLTNTLTPLSPYFPVLLAFAARYQPGMKIGTFISLMVPAAVVFAIGWILLLIVWVSFGWDLGPGAPLRYELKAL